jgi:hypothetical protein
MKRFRWSGVALLAVLLLGALAAQSAQASVAPYWSIQGSRLKKGQTHFITAKTFNGGTFVLSAATTKITCKALSTPNGVLLGSEEGEPGTNNEILKFSECEAAAGANVCTSVKSPGEPNGTIVTFPLKSELVEDAATKKLLLVLFTPENAELEFVKLELAGAGCVNTTVTGQEVASVLTDETEQKQVELGVVRPAATSWLLSIPSPQPTHLWLVVKGTGVESAKLEPLKAFGAAATEVGTALVLLANAKRETESPGTLWSPLP